MSRKALSDCHTLLIGRKAGRSSYVVATASISVVFIGQIDCIDWCECFAWLSGRVKVFIQSGDGDVLLHL